MLEWVATPAFLPGEFKDRGRLQSMGFSRQEYWSGVSLPSSKDLPNPGTEPVSLASLALASGFLTTEQPGYLKVKRSRKAKHQRMAKDKLN